jgi:hypothetical protein
MSESSKYLPKPELDWLPKRSQILFYLPLIKKREKKEVIIIHYIMDTYRHVQLEIERRSPTLGIKFERIFM